MELSSLADDTPLVVGEDLKETAGDYSHTAAERPPLHNNIYASADSKGDGSKDCVTDEIPGK